MHEIIKFMAARYAQMLGQIFTHEMKPMEVEIVVAEIDAVGSAELYRIQYDGTVADEQHWCCIGGDSESVLERLAEGWSADLNRDGAVNLAVSSLAGPDRTIAANELEVAVLAADNGRRCFHRLSDSETESGLGQ